MKLINKFIYGALITVSAAGLSSCSSFLEEYSQDLAKVNSWEDLDEVLSGSAYVNVGRTILNTYYGSTADRDTDFDILHFMSDELSYTTEDNYLQSKYRDKMFAFYTWQKDTGVDTQLRYKGGDAVYFDDLYGRINICNMVLSIIDDQPATHPNDEVQKRRVKGEAQFLRALYYFMLANLYCEPYNPATADSQLGMPLKLSEVIEDVEFNRGTLKQTYECILKDLADAEKNLEGITHKSVYRADIHVTHLLQSRVYLYMQDWDNAIAKAKLVLDYNDALQNIGSINVGDECLTAASPEILFTMGDFCVAYIFRDSPAYIPSFSISDDILNLYSDDDYRATRYIGNSENQNPNVLTKVNGNSSAMGGYTYAGSVFTFRTAEAYLTIAEASGYKEDPTTAKNYLEKFLNTRMEGGHTTVSQSGNALIDLIRDERAREFLLEGHRWFDLRRYTVCQPYPWSKEIIHGYFFNNDYSRYHHTDWYKLEKNDKAYTLPLPREVRSFQVSLGNVDRPDRRVFETTETHVKPAN